METRENPIQDYLSYALAAAHRKMSASLNARLKKHGIQIEAWRILETLETDQRLTMGQLAEVVLMNPPTLTKLVDRLVSDGLVHRQVAQADHRQINVLPTALGKKRMLQVREEVQDQDAALESLIGKDDAGKLIELLRGIA
ncbi:MULTISPECIES: MarR family winged helix-turn-helix transcriptional regulator [Rhodobacterales]|jgi:DNA-binding MarR family transcriptional regulator|uniref:Transcriptional regulator n=1 Tax=Phaeobacter gallaeciensis TaxID=60890 RepID=A0A1B0ZN21_9RHOB|nr:MULTISPECIES: MarR family transcriptional regulator [Phaeobacter]MDF1774306.1 MarR family transcriptional regulator [Pseudophaeobacter sp. bin_em_oilr2.035]MEE2634819.1 MarR family transcriptional regulator [Pseudomonadota bacterium]ANP35511.1 transcriptional regulator [Phaeobacter gallaeciensis]MDE4063526.1 MarR family transcriptional regulator [Phaeobacter gallaeciensis]MDE4098626.1 MarR family transcriptional regulator [Phaeobacter gallaeciensis]